jgi:hypothetical protein
MSSLMVITVTVPAELCGLAQRPSRRLANPKASLEAIFEKRGESIALWVIDFRFERGRALAV